MYNLMLVAAFVALGFSGQEAEVRVQGYVFDSANESPIDEATVKVLFEGDLIIDGVETNDDGVFELTLPQKGTFLFQVSKDGYSFAELEVDTDDEESIDVSIGLDSE